MPHEVGTVKGDSSKQKSIMQDRFLGRKRNTSTASYDEIADSKRMKVLIGTSAINEGINLQRYGLVGYDLFLSWNPTERLQKIGRFFRQGNMFYNCFVVTPTMADSMDIFMLQKLEEKTARIGDLWNRELKDNVLKTEEFDPEEIKYHLISDPSLIAKMESKEKR